MIALLIAATWKGSLLVALVLLVTRALRGHMPARWAHALLLVALVRLLLPIAPQSPVSLFNLAQQSGLVVVAEPGPPGMKRGAAAFRPPALDIGGLKPAAPRPWELAVVAIWGAGVLLMLVRLGVQTVKARRLVRGTPANDQVIRLVDECRDVMGVRQHVTVVLSDASDAPALHGVFRPTLLLPPALTREQLRFVILHELAHLRRLDVVTNWVAAVAHALHWFNPLVRLAVSRLAEERELACDALALRALSGAERSAYGGTVLQLHGSQRVPEAVPGLVGMSASKQQLKRRIEMIARFQSESRRGVWVALVLALAVTSLTDARAGTVRKRMHTQAHSAETIAVIEALDKDISANLTMATIDELLSTVSGLTGVSIKVAEGAIDDETRQARVTLRADNVPAHLVLMESLIAFDLALRFTDTGAEVTRAGEHGTFNVPAPPPDGEARKDTVFLRRSAREAPEGAKQLTARVEISEDDSGRKVTVHREGARDGTLEISVDRAN